MKRKTDKRLTIYEVAEKAKVSIATVSRALNLETRSKLAPETLEKIETIIKKFNYIPSFAAKGLARSTFYTIGVLLPHGEGLFKNDYYTHILSGISDSLLDCRYRIKMLMLKCATPRWDQYPFRTAEGIDGLIVTHWHAFFSDKTIFKKLGIPCAIIGDPEQGVHAHGVSGDQKMGGKLAAEFLYQEGHRKFAVMTGSPNSIDSQLRLEGFREFLVSKGIKIRPELIVCGHFQEHEAFKVAAEKLVSRKKDFTALFCLNDGMAFGAIRQFELSGIRCPEDISVMGFDDEERAKSFQPSLTTIRVPLYQIARKACEILTALLERKMKEPDFYGHTTLLPVELVSRKSVKALSPSGKK